MLCTPLKSAGLGAVVPYAEAIRESQRTFVTAQGQLHEAMASPDGIRCAFQQIVDVTNGKILGFESLSALVSDIAERGLPLHRMVLEITEQTLNDLDQHEFAASLTRARAQGARVDIDDFGQGASNLAAVAQLPIDIVKVDRSLVPRSTDDAGWQLLSAVAELGRAFGRRVVAEGMGIPGASAQMR
jgi:EAL domain-containing protein (putative c-di-GMP-specific phosphodiesterase class I)